MTRAKKETQETHVCYRRKTLSKTNMNLEGLLHNCQLHCKFGHIKEQEGQYVKVELENTL